jgi:hypothetical protein
VTRERDLALVQRSARARAGGSPVRRMRPIRRVQPEGGTEGAEEILHLQWEVARETRASCSMQG